MDERLGAGRLEPISKSIFEETGLSSRSQTHREASNLAENARIGLSVSCACTQSKPWFLILR